MNVFKTTIPTINLPETNKLFDLKFEEIYELLIYNIFRVHHSPTIRCNRNKFLSK